MLKTTNITLIHLIENKPKEVYEENLLVYVESAKRSNINYFDKFAQINFVRPTEKYDISDRVKDEIKSINAKYQTTTFKEVQKHDQQNFTLIPQFCYQSSQSIDTEYLLWHDLDVMILSDDVFDFGETDKIITNIVEIPKSNKSKDEILHDIETNNSFQELFGDIYEHLIEKHLPKKYRVGKLTHYMNTWIIYGSKHNEFWKEWIDLTEMIVRVIQDKFPELIECELESISEELAGSILYSENADRFENLNTNYYALGDEAYTDKTRVIHYEEFYYCNNIRPMIGKILHDLKITKDLVRKKNISAKDMVDFSKL